MNNRSILISFLLSGTCLLSCVDPALAQDVGNQPVDQSKADAAVSPADIIVTGSRAIKNGDAMPSPVTVVQPSTMLAVQPGTLADALNGLPVFSGARGRTSNPTSTGSGGAGNGSANQLNLRNLGATRTLVLMDGLRVPPTLLNGVVDVDIIPQMLVSRVDTVTGGVSAVYGSDAVSGVVNYILDKKFNGLKIQASSGISQRGDAGNMISASPPVRTFSGDAGILRPVTNGTRRTASDTVPTAAISTRLA